MQYVLNLDPELQRSHYTVDALIQDVLPTTAKTVATISLLATATHSKDAVLLANDVAKGFSDYIRSLNQQNLDTWRKNLTDQVSSYQQQKASWEAKISSLTTNTTPQYTVYNNNLIDTTRTLDMLQTRLQALPLTVNGNVSIIELAGLNTVTSTPKGLIILAAITGLGLLIGILVMLLLIFLDKQLRSEEEVKEKLGQAYLGGISNSDDIETSPTRPTGAVAQQLSDICANLRLTGVLASQRQAPQGATLLITSPQTAEGKTSLAEGLAATMARGGNTVVVIDSNLAHPSTHLTFGKNDARIGLSGLLQGRGTLDDTIVPTSIQGVWLLPAGSPLENPSFLIEQKMPGILKQLRTKADLIIIDGPALLSGADTLLLASMADGVALVVDARHENLQRLVRSKELLSSLVHTPTGIVMNHLPRRHNDSYYAIAYPTMIPSEKPLAVQTSTRGKGKGNISSPPPLSWKESVSL
jgi:capsular exopolysaccharide synthesis family protein